MSSAELKRVGLQLPDTGDLSRRRAALPLGEGPQRPQKAFSGPSTHPRSKYLLNMHNAL